MRSVASAATTLAPDKPPKPATVSVDAAVAKYEKAHASDPAGAALSDLFRRALKKLDRKVAKIKSPSLRHAVLLAGRAQIVKLVAARAAAARRAALSRKV